MKIVFFGSSDFSVPPFEFCLKSAHQLVAVVTTPDRPKGRGLHLQANPLKERAEKAGVITFVPESLKDPEIKEKIAALDPDLFIVASYGKLIPSSWLEIPKIAAWNIHPSLLPKYRGAAPIAWQILNGEKETGVTIFLVVKELDAGDIVHQVRIPLGSKATTESLTKRLAELSCKALEEALEKLKKGNVTHTPQDSSQSSYARKLTKEDGNLNWSDSAEQLDRKIRAFHPWPGAYIQFKNERLRIVEAETDYNASDGPELGTLLEINLKGYLRIQTGEKSLKVLKVQLPGKKVFNAIEFANGQHLKPGFAFE